MFYKLLGILVWKAIKLYVRQKAPSKAIAAATVVGVIGLAAALARARGRADA